MGAFGVTMGFAAFVVVREHTQAEAASPATFLLSLLAAALTSFAIESVRERAEGHAHGGTVEPGRVLGLIVLLAVFELYVMGAEAVVKLVVGGHASTFVSDLFVSGITAGLTIVPQLLLFAGLWVVLGAAAAWSMMPEEVLAETDAPGTRSSFTAAAGRIGRGLLLVATLAMTYVIIARLLLTLWVLLTRPQDYVPAFGSLLSDSTTETGNPFARVAILLASALEGLAHLGRWGGVLLLAVTIGLTVTVARAIRVNKSASVPVRIIVLTLILLVLGPFATSPTQFARLLRIVSATTLTWLAPLVVLAVATPLLRAPSRSPRVWGIVAFAVAVVLVLVTWDRLSEPPVPMFVASFVVALAVTGWLFWRGADVVKFWPLIALTLGIAAFEGSSLLQHLSFFTTFKEAALLQAAPLAGGVEARAARGFRAVAEWQRDGSVDSSTAATVAAVETLAETPTEQQLALLQQRTSAALDRAFTAAIDPLCQTSGSALLDTLHRNIAAWCTRVRALGDIAPDSAQRFWRALVAEPEPWGDGLTSLLVGASQEATREAFAFRWQPLDATSSRNVAERAGQELRGGDVGRDPPELLTGAMTDSSVAPSIRMWMVLDAFARTAPPDERLNRWLNDWDQREFAAAQRGDGLMLQWVMSLWIRRARHLVDLVDARYIAGVPAAAPPSGMRLAPRRADRFARETRTVLALRFAAEQVRTRQQELESSNALRADTGATVLLELSLGASFAFWCTAGLLAGFSRQESHPAP